MAIKKRKKPAKGGLRIKTSFEGQPPKGLETHVYAFDGAGNFLASARLEDGVARLNLEAEQAAAARLFFGPPMRGDHLPTLKRMERANAFEAAWRFDPASEIQRIDPLPELHWRWWPWCPCRVRGRVVRPVRVHGTTQELPVCRARVHICEVDQVFRVIEVLPDDLIPRLRDDLVAVINHPRPLPDPPPFTFDPGVIDPSPINVARMLTAKRQTVAAPVLEAVAEAAVGGEPARIAGPGPAAPALLSLPAETRAALTSPSVPIVRQALLDHVKLITPYLCLLHWFWGWLTCDELKVVTVDRHGRFDTTIFYPCFGDKPDLYFWVEAFVGGTWTTVYRPHLSCATFWNYPCGSSVTIRVTNPLAPVCDPGPTLAGLQVAVMGIGKNVSISEIESGTSNPKRGLIKADGAPFAGSIEPNVWFGRAALIASGITHYRWSYRRLTRADGTPVSDVWHVMDKAVQRHYALVDTTKPDRPLTFPVYALGPNEHNLFKIQPLGKPADLTIPPGHTFEGWAPINQRQDSATGYFLSHLLAEGDAKAAAGRYELKLELFDAAGNRVDLDAAGVLLKEATSPAPFTAGASTQPATAEHTLKAGGKTVGFRFVIFVDNNPAEAEIFPVSGTGVTVDTACGFVEYESGATVDLSFKARHENGFATFNFDVHRGPSNPVSAASAAGKVGAASVNGFLRNPATGIFTKTVPVTSLLGSCDNAAFSETLHVEALATDGWADLEYLDKRATPKAFALAKKKP
ncbi:MAG: hypothetical protein D6696_01350 [Acidobacteria bacterium]|nr:MAG: hypothetical protein D6696_01350 [Acidobacteriota bacterium]